MKYYRGKDRRELQSTLRNRSFRSTEGRLGLLGILKRSQVPLSVPEIARRLGKNLNEVNVYRALEALTRVGILTRSDVRRGGAHYEFAQHHHHHVICRSCGKTEDVEDCEGDKLETRVLASSSFARIDTHALEFFGTCRPCAGQKL